MNTDHFSELKKAVQEFKDNYPQLSIDNAFVAWFLRAFIIGNDEGAMRALTGGSSDKGIDAIHIDHEARTIFVLQGKYHEGTNIPNEQHSDVIALSQIGETLLLDKKNRFDSLIADADVTVQDMLIKARRVLQKRDYRLTLQFVTTGKISSTHRKEAEAQIDDYPRASYEAYSRDDLIRLMQDYLEGVAPPVPALHIPIYQGELFGIYDKDTEISSWIFSVQGHEIAKIFNEIGIRLFARNIRGFLGNTAINKEIETTLKGEPELFWYFNNGITIICDEAKQISEKGRKHIRATNAQIINGQQTTRVLSRVKNNKDAMVMVKLIELPHKTEEAHSRFKKIVGKIVRATNRQNAIGASDLKSNDTEQVRIEREFRKLNYHYIRKRQSKREARLATGKNYSFVINKEELVQRAAACLLSPYEVRLGKNRLFEDDLYGKIFNENRSIFDYLLFYWLGRFVIRFIKKDIRRGYAKWLVLNYVWKEIGGELRRSAIRRKFLHMSERYYKYEKEFRPLYRAIEQTFVTSLAFFRENKHSERGGLLDASTFFKRVKLYAGFKKFLRKEKKRSDRMKSSYVSFLKNLQKAEI